jgi:hypothetical protein
MAMKPGVMRMERRESAVRESGRKICVAAGIWRLYEGGRIFP